MEKKNNFGTFIVIGLIILGYLGLKVAQKYSFNKEYQSSYNGSVIKQKPGSRGFDDLYISNGSCIHLAFYSGWVKESSFVEDSISKDENSREIRVYKKNSKEYQYYKYLEMID